MANGFSYSFVQKIKADFKKRPDNKILEVVNLCIKHDVPLVEVAEDIGVSRQAMYAWLAGDYAPNATYLASAEKVIKKLKKQYEE